MPRTGRRPGGADTRAEVLAAARQQFAARGYAGATIRAIATAAGVDPALVHHYFGTKRELFVTAIQLPLDPVDVVAAAMDGDPENAGERLARALLRVWEDEQGRTRTQSLLRSVLSDDELLGVVREFMVETVLSPLTTALSPDRHRLRSTLLASQVIGLAIVRHVVELEPLASVDDDTVIAAVAPTFQRYLTGDLGTS